MNANQEEFEDEEHDETGRNSHSNGERSPSSSSSSSSRTSPLSESVAKAIFLLLGVGILIPWNAFISAKPYFQARLCSDDGKDIVNFELWFGLIWNLSSVFSLGIIIAAQSISDYCKNRRSSYTASAVLVADAASDDVLLSVGSDGSHQTGEDDGVQHQHEKDHSFWLVMVPLALYMSVFVATDLLVLVPSMEPHRFLVVTLVGLGLCGTCGAIATAGIVATAGLFPSHVGINPFFSGQALGGVAVSVANFIAASLEEPASFWNQNCQSKTVAESFQLANDSSIGFRFLLRQNDTDQCTPYSEYDWAVFAYFLAGCIILALCLVGYSYIHKYQESEHRDDYEVVRDNVPVDESPRIGLEMNDRIHARKGENMLQSSSYQSEVPDDPLATPTANSVIENRAPPEELLNDEDEYTDEENEVAVFWAIKGPFACILGTFAVTLSLFPGWVSQLRSSHECQTHFRLANDLYMPFNFVVFNVGDLAGRILSEKVPVERISHMSLKLNIVAVSRLIFLPLLLLCVSENSQSSGRNVLPVIESDIYSFLVQFIFAFSNGMLISCSFMHGPHLVSHTTGMQERASEMLTFAVFFGLLSGSLLSFPVSQLASLL